MFVELHTNKIYSNLCARVVARLAGLSVLPWAYQWLIMVLCLTCLGTCDGALIWQQLCQKILPHLNMQMLQPCTAIYCRPKICICNSTALQVAPAAIEECNGTTLNACMRFQKQKQSAPLFCMLPLSIVDTGSLQQSSAATMAPAQSDLPVVDMQPL